MASYTHFKGGLSVVARGIYFGKKGSETLILGPGTTAAMSATNMYFNMGAAVSTTGSNFTLSSSRTQTMFVGGDDGNAAITSGIHIAAARFRTLLTYTGGNREQEVSSVRGQLVSKSGTNRHNMCAVLGSYEVNTGLTVDGQAPATDPWIQAGVIGRVGAGSGITTINANGRLCGVAAMSATASFAANNGAYIGYYVGHWSGSADFTHGVYIESDTAAIGIYVGDTSGNSIQVNNTNIASGDSYSGIRVNVANDDTDVSNEYGIAAYFDSTLNANAGTDNTGHLYNVGSWINFGSGYVPAAGLLHIPYECGIYDGGATLTNARLVLFQGQAILASNPASLHVMRLNYNRGTGAHAITAVFAAANAGSIGYTAGSGTSGTQVGYIPIADIVGTGVVYIRVYNSAT